MTCLAKTTHVTLIARIGDGAMQLKQAIKSHLLQPRTKTAGVYLPFYTPLQNNQELPQPISLYDKNLLQYRTKVPPWYFTTSGLPANKEKSLVQPFHTHQESADKVS